MVEVEEPRLASGSRRAVAGGHPEILIMFRSTARCAAATFLLFAAASCQNPSQPAATDSTPTIVPVTGVKVAPQSIVFTTVGETRQIALDVAPANATDPAVTWESTDVAVATVDATGLVTARGAGAGVFITVFTHDGHLQASVNVSVTP